MDKSMILAAIGFCAAVAFADANAVTNIVEKEDVCVVSSDDDVARLAGSLLILRGTLDLNGHDVSVNAMNTLLDEKINGTAIASVASKITNSAGGTATFTVQGGSAYFTGSVDPSVNFVFNGGEMQMLVTDKAFAPARFAVSRGTVMAFSNPTWMFFVFRDVPADEKKIRLGELMPTYQGVSAEATRAFISHSNMNATWYDLLTTSFSFWGGADATIPEDGAVVAFQTGDSGFSGAIGCVKIDGYRMGTPEEPSRAMRRRRGTSTSSVRTIRASYSSTAAGTIR